MSIDAVKRNTSYRTERHSLEEERKAEVERLEKEYQDQVEQARKSREKDLQNLHESTQREVAQKHRDADFRIKQAEGAANERIRSFQDDTQRLTDEARRQFQEKATELSKSAREIQEQRKFLLQQNEESLKQLAATHEEVENSMRAKQSDEQGYLDSQQKERLQRLHKQAELNEKDLNEQAQDRRQHLMASINRDLNSLKQNLYDARKSFQRQLQHEQGTQAEQIEDLKQNAAITALKTQYDLEDKVDQLTRDSRGEIMRVSLAADQALHDTEVSHKHDLTEMEKVNKKQVRDLQNLSSTKMGTIASDASIRETLMKRDFDIRADQLKKQQEQDLIGLTKKNKEFKEKVDTQYEQASQALLKHRDTGFTETTKEIQNELNHLKNLGQKQINQEQLKNLKTISAHETRNKDAFYHVHSIHADINETGNELLVEVKVPQHEQDRVNLSYKNSQIHLNGTRAFEGSAKSENGRNISTKSYQSFSESFPTSGALNIKEMKREYSDGKLKFRIPKF